MGTVTVQNLPPEALNAEAGPPLEFDPAPFEPPLLYETDAEAAAAAP